MSVHLPHYWCRLMSIEVWPAAADEYARTVGTLGVLFMACIHKKPSCKGTKTCGQPTPYDDTSFSFPAGRKTRNMMGMKARDDKLTPTFQPEATNFAAANQAGRTAGARHGYSR
jgi:hypothetical protein